MLPWLAHGHISPYFTLAKKLSRRNFSVRLYSSPVNLTSIKPKHGGPADTNFELVDIHLPPTPELPPHLHTTRGLPPRLLPLLEHLFAESGPRILTDILHSFKPDLIITDPKNSQWVLPLIEDRENKDVKRIPLVFFNLGAASATSFAFHLGKYGFESRSSYPFPEIHLKDADIKRMLRVINAWAINNEPSLDDCGDKCLAASNVDFVLFRTSRVLEGKYIDYLSELTNKKVVPLGSLLDIDDDKVNNNARSGDDDISRWLNKKPDNSTVYVSFGSECYLQKRELDELALGLEQSGVNFIWVIRFPEQGKMSIEEALPEGFIERVGERGMILEGWAPQFDILRHPSVGGFVSQCGLNSLIESIVFGVPIIAMPMQYEQPFNARMAVEHGVAFEIEITDEEGYYTREEIAKVIKRVMVEKGGDDIRARVRELGQRVDGGKGDELDIAIKELEQLVNPTHSPLP